MFNLGMKVKTKCGSYESPYYVHGVITDTEGELFKVEWDDGGYDYCYDFELEVA